MSRFTKRSIAALAASLILIGLVVGFRFVQVNTEIGILALGGAGYWVGQALEAPDIDEARECLRRVIDSGNYGVNAAQDAVNDLDQAEQRLRLFTILVDIAPNDIWERLYRMDLENQREILGDIHSSSSDDV